MEIKYSKMTGSGNDFIVVDNMDKHYKIADILPHIPAMCARGISIGADGFIMIEPAEGADFMWHFYNSDGSLAEMCGNGSRCAVRFAYLKGYVGKTCKFKTVAGIITGEIKEGVNVKVQLTPYHSMVTDKEASLTKKHKVYSFVNTGVPHVVIFDDDIEKANITEEGRTIRYHDEFAPSGANVNFIALVSPDTLRVRTYERGVEGETLACGTGCTASALVAIEKGIAKSPVKLITTGKKNLTVYKENGRVFLEGEARLLSEGTILKEAIEY